MLVDTAGLKEMTIMFSFRTVSAVSILGLLVTLAGCSGAAESGSGSDTTGTARSEVAAQRDERGPRGPHRGGPGGGGLLVAALHEPSLNLTAEQTSTIKGALDASRPQPPQGGGFDKAKVAPLAAGIRAGKVDASMFPAKPDFAAHQAAEAKALTTLHDTLSADQRQALVAAVKSRAGEHGPKGDHGGPKGDGPKGDHKGKGPHGPHAGGPGGGPMMHGMLADLNLTDAQKEQLRAKREADRPAPPTDEQKAQWKAQHEAMKGQMDAKLQTFASGSSDANAFVAKPEGVGPKAGGEDRMVKEMNDVLSVLDANQREALARKIEAGPPARPQGK